MASKVRQQPLNNKGIYPVSQDCGSPSMMALNKTPSFDVPEMRLGGFTLDPHTSLTGKAPEGPNEASSASEDTQYFRV